MKLRNRSAIGIYRVPDGATGTAIFAERRYRWRPRVPEIGGPLTEIHSLCRLGLSPNGGTRGTAPLARVRACLADPRRTVVARTTAAQMIAAHFGWDYGGAVAFAKEVVRGLTEENFYRRTTMADGTPADEYGVVREGISWYVKLFITGNPARLLIVSCHLPQWDIPTPAGIVTCTQRGLRKR